MASACWSGGARPQQSWLGTDVHEEGIKVFQSWLDLNGPLFGPVLYLFEYVRSYLEERAEAFDTRFGTDTAAPFFGRNQKPATHFYTATTASLIYEILNSIPLRSHTFAFVDMGSGKGRALLVASNSHIICTESQKKTSSGIAPHPSSARHSICIA